MTVEIIGPPDAPVVVVLGGISASRHVTATLENPEPGWWERVVGDRKTIDTTRYCVLSVDYEDAGRDGEPLTTHDQARSLAKALDDLGIACVHAIVGASYGGMVALAFGELAPERADRLVVIGAAHESTPLATALRILQRRIIELGLRSGRPRDAIVIARGLAMTTYSTVEEFAQRFSAVDQEPGITQRLIEDSLTRSGEAFARSCTTERFLAMSKALDLHRVVPEEIHVPTTLVAIEQDTLVPLATIRELAGRLGAPHRLVELSSHFGHDTFLSAPGLLAPHVVRALSSSIPAFA